MRPLIIFLLLFPLYAEALIYRQDLQGKGYATGIVTQESQNTFSVYMKLPSSEHVQSARIHLHIESSPLLKEPSNLKVLFQGAPLAHISLTGNGSESLQQKTLMLEIPPTLIKGRFGRFDFQFVNVISGDPCIDQRMSAGLVRIMEKSFFEINLSDSPITLGDFLLTLPEEVKIAVPENLGPNTIKLLYQILAIVQDKGSTTQFTSDPNEAHVVVSDTEMNSGLQVKDGKTQLILSTSSPFIAAPFLNGMGGIFRTGSVPAMRLKRSGQKSWLTRNELGLSAKGESTPNGHQWNFQVPKLEGTSQIPTKLHLSLTSARSFGKVPTSLYVYLGEELLRVISLPDSDLPQYHQVLLPSRLPEWPVNVRVQIRRNDQVGKCGEDHGKDFDIRLLEDMGLEYGTQKQKSLDFADFARSDSPYDVVVPGNNQSILPWIHQLAWLRKSFDLNVDEARFVDKATDSPRRILFQQASSEGQHELAYLGTQRLTIKGLSSLALVALHSEGEKQVLTMKSFGEPFAIRAPKFLPDHHDVLAISPERIEVISFTSEMKTRVAKLAEGPSLMTFIEEWRYHLMGLMWLILTLIFLALGRKFR